MGKQVLIVDDSAMMRKIIKKTLSPSDHTIIGEAKNGAEGLDLYKELKPDVVTMDITMRGMDGITAAKEILVYDKEARIIFLSNLDEGRYRKEVEDLGAVGFTNKHRGNRIIELIDQLD